MQTVLEMDSITKKQCTALRRTLVDAYKIIAQGANDIMNVRHDVSEVQEEHRKRKQLLCRKPPGQQLITDWLRHKRKRAAEMPEDNMLPQEQDEEDENGQENLWVPPLNHGIRDELRQELLMATSPDTIMTSQGNTHIRARQLQNFLDGGKIDNEVMGAFCRLLDSGHNKRHCKIFKPGLYDALGQGKLDQRTAKRRKDDERRYTQELDIFQYEVVLILV